MHTLGMNPWRTLGVLLALCGCDDGAATAGNDAGVEPDGPTWHGEVAALVTVNCVGCHRAGGAAPFVLDSYAAAAPLASAMANAVSEGRMPPWNPGPDCREYRDERVLSSDEIDTLTAWAAAGAREGVDTGAELPEPPSDSFEPTMVTMAPEPYMPNPDAPDDYRCLILDAEFAEATFVRGIEVVPDQGALVHHALLYAIPPGDVPALQDLDDRDEGPGYSCFGGVGVGLPTSQGGWVPGSGASVWPDGRATYIPAGGKLVLQVHYNLSAASPAPDQTAVHLMASNVPPAQIVAGQPLATLDLEIAAGDPDATITREFTWFGEAPLEVVGVVGHMHLLGVRMSLEIVRAEGDDCLLDIPKWDFSWQELFILKEPAVIQPGEKVRLSCTFDNSPGNQAVVNGEQGQTRDVAWGEGTLDEMCFASLTRATDYDPATLGAATCAGVGDCLAKCDDPDSLYCVARCLGSDVTCGQCLVGALAQCSVPSCIDQLEAARNCITHCLLFGANPDACMRQDCPAEYDAVEACVGVATEGGTCDAAMAACL